MTQPDLAQPSAHPMAEVIADMLAGDPPATVRFFEVATPAVRSIVLRAFGDACIWVDQDRLHDIVHDGVVELVRLAPRWRADGGAAPWTWARAALIAAAFSGLGVFADEIPAQLSDDTDDVPCRGHRSGASVLDDLADEHPLVARLAEALGHVANDRDRHVWIDLLVEEAGGNGRAAVTVAQTHGLSHSNVRKIRQRVQTGLVGLTDEPRFRELADLPVLCA